MLSEHEQRRLAEIESILSGQDPPFVRRFTGEDVDRHPILRRWSAVVVGMAGVAGTVEGLARADVAMAVVAICTVGVGGGIWTWRSATRARH